MTLARDGWREMLLSTLTLGAGAAACFWAASSRSGLWLAAAIPLAGLWAFTLAFFRIPGRTVPQETGIMVSPADGRVTEITRLESHEGIEGPALRIGIFLSVFDVHVNCAPCDGTVLRSTHKPGEFLDARHPECGVRNESNTLVLQPEGMAGPVIVRQIAGLIARRIVCKAGPGHRLRRGELFGLIKFGSRTELIVPADCGLEAAVSVGQHVKGRSTVLMAPRAAGREAGAGASLRRSVEEASTV